MRYFPFLLSFLIFHGQYRHSDGGRVLGTTRPLYEVLVREIETALYENDFYVTFAFSDRNFPVMRSWILRLRLGWIYVLD